MSTKPGRSPRECPFALGRTKRSGIAIGGTSSEQRECGAWCELYDPDEESYCGLISWLRALIAGVSSVHVRLMEIRDHRDYDD